MYVCLDYELYYPRKQSQLRPSPRNGSRSLRNQQRLPKIETTKEGSEETDPS